MEIVILPVLLFLSAFAGIYFDFHGSKGLKKWGGGISILVVLIVICGFDISSKSRSKADAEQSKKDNGLAQQKITDLNKKVDKLKKTIASNNDPGYIENTKKRIRERRQKMTVYYYKKSKDYKLLEKKLKELEGESYNFKKVKVEKCESEEDCRNTNNAIVFGSNVLDADIKIVADRMFNGNAKIKTVRRFSDPDNKQYDIEIQYDDRANICDGSWNYEKLMDFETKFSRSRFSESSTDPKVKGCSQ